MTVKKVGLIVNPIAGMGGRVGLKGTDGPEALRQALERGATPEATEKTLRALEKLMPIRDNVRLLTCAGDMGETAARQLGFDVEIVYRAGEGDRAGDGDRVGDGDRAGEGDRAGDGDRVGDGDREGDRVGDGDRAGDGDRVGDGDRAGDGDRVGDGDRADHRAGEGDRDDARGGAGGSGPGGSEADDIRNGAAETTGEDTRAAARALADRGVALLLFAGGDGTARDVFAAVGAEQVVLGIPAGVKIHSPVYANSPGQAGDLARLYLTDGTTPVGEKEVLDIDEEAVRRDVLQTSLHGYLRVPLHETFMQNPKSPSGASEQSAQLGIAEEVVENMEADTCYIIGPGTTTRAIMQTLELPFTLLGVDAVLNGEVLGLDVAERDILAYIERYACRLVLTPTGGQGYLLGRGNQQISGDVVKRIGKEGLIVVATGDKMRELRGKPLLVDTGDAEADDMLAGFHRVKTGYRQEMMHRIAAG